MKVKDKGDGLSREGSGRVSIYNATSCTHCYTLECNYASGKKLNHLPVKYNKEKNIIEPESYLTDPKSQLYRNKPPVYNMEIFEDIGRATVISILDLADDNPISRVPKSIYKDVCNMKLEMSLQNNINVAQAKRQKQDNMRKNVEEQERKKRPPIVRKSTKRPILTPSAEGRINKMHRGQSCTSVGDNNDDEKSKSKISKARSNSFDKPKTKSSKSKVRNHKKKLNIKQSNLAKHFSQNNKQNSEVIESVLETRKKSIVLKGKSHDSTKTTENSKNSVQNSSRSYFRLGKNIEHNYFQKNCNRSSRPGLVRGVDSFIKSRSKQMRPSVKLSEIQPIGLCGVAQIQQGNSLTYI